MQLCVLRSKIIGQACGTANMRSRVSHHTAKTLLYPACGVARTNNQLQRAFKRGRSFVLKVALMQLFNAVSKHCLRDLGTQSF